MKITSHKAAALRSVSPDTVPSRASETTPGLCSYREPGDDFFCLRYRVWYASFDCAYRTRFRTSPGCLDCDQGRFNLKRHAAAMARVSRPFRRTCGE